MLSQAGAGLQFYSMLYYNLSHRQSKPSRYSLLTGNRVKIGKWINLKKRKERGWEVPTHLLLQASVGSSTGSMEDTFPPSGEEDPEDYRCRAGPGGLPLSDGKGGRRDPPRRHRPHEQHDGGPVLRRTLHLGLGDFTGPGLRVHLLR